MTRAQRVFDIAVTMVLIPPALVIGAAVALAVLADSPGGVFYRCRRVGRDGREFTMLKFRKMRDDACDRPLTTGDDDRLTPIGRFLTVTKLDELPQLWNVLKGDMRLVGPRPEVKQFVDSYPEQYREILSATPGITGLAQLRYAHELGILTHAPDATRVYTESILPAKLELDRRYLSQRSVRADAAILMRTVFLPWRGLQTAVHRHVSAMPHSSRLASALGGSAALALLTLFAVQAGSLY